MKKLVSVLLILMLFSSAFALEIDPASLDDVELSNLKKIVDEEFTQRFGYAKILEPGRYKVGREIEAGPYIFKTLHEKYSIVDIAYTEENLKTEEYDEYGYTAKGEDYYAYLEEGYWISPFNRVLMIKVE